MSLPLKWAGSWTDMSGRWLESGRKVHLNLETPHQPSPPHTRQGELAQEIQKEGSWGLNPHCPSPLVQLLGLRGGCRHGAAASRALTCSAVPRPDASPPAQGSGELVPRREWWLHRRLRRSAAPGHVRACVTKELSRPRLFAPTGPRGDWWDLPPLCTQNSPSKSLL